MIVVADTSVILNLCCVGQQELLPPLRARHAALLPAIAPVVDQLERQANFWVAAEIRMEALRLAGEAT